MKHLQHKAFAATYVRNRLNIYNIRLQYMCVGTATKATSRYNTCNIRLKHTLLTYVYRWARVSLARHGTIGHFFVSGQPGKHGKLSRSCLARGPLYMFLEGEGTRKVSKGGG
jgi:hypothetical protein